MPRSASSSATSTSWADWSENPARSRIESPRPAASLSRNTMIYLRSVAILACALTAAALPMRDATAQSYPTQPVKLVVPFPAGSATDNIARVLAKELQDDLGQPFIVDNRPGAQGV